MRHALPFLMISSLVSCASTVEQEVVLERHTACIARVLTESYAALHAGAVEAQGVFDGDVARIIYLASVEYTVSDKASIQERSRINIWEDRGGWVFNRTDLEGKILSMSENYFETLSIECGLEPKIMYP